MSDFEEGAELSRFELAWQSVEHLNTLSSQLQLQATAYHASPSQINDEQMTRTVSLMKSSYRIFVGDILTSDAENSEKFRIIANTRTNGLLNRTEMLNGILGDAEAISVTFEPTEGKSESGQPTYNADDPEVDDRTLEHDEIIAIIENEAETFEGLTSAQLAVFKAHSRLQQPVYKRLLYLAVQNRVELTKLTGAFAAGSFLTAIAKNHSGRKS